VRRNLPPYSLVLAGCFLLSAISARFDARAALNYLFFLPSLNGTPEILHRILTALKSASIPKFSATVIASSRLS
jgi:hypothetical protein